jgi:hypothetical protein
MGRWIRSRKALIARDVDNCFLIERGILQRIMSIGVVRLAHFRYRMLLGLAVFTFAAVGHCDLLLGMMDKRIGRHIDPRPVGFSPFDQ